MQYQQDKKYALVTGGNKGIGFAICQKLLVAGFDVILTARSLERAKVAAAQLNSPASQIQVFQMDLTDDSSIHSMTESLSQTITHLDVLINNAGVFPDQDVSILTVSRDLLQIGMNTNTFGTIHLTQTLLPLLEKSSEARIINVSSERGQFSGLATDVPSYSLSKLALNGATILLAEALKPKGIAVYAMWPGWVRTDMGGEQAPLSPEQGADTVIWLATQASPSLSGKYFYKRQEISYS
ncbi:SDR family NAD(P)-dependent oxidoreductase [Moorena sp. SIO4G3]|uniref:SDR family NAD(P)-dependent oxidoreductase n=1 Tax=Moorena sp. SIO4G3 TaxID=2607821 RepID=UPI00142C89A2|nr:SDR family NAD(P)-dependent oxidoreductase [Moorena sp. SIO4G3]NEO79846.1 SDR family NAD(P)-dependent oxidoreductase [Moorena sp. SIO4G3]